MVSKASPDATANFFSVFLAPIALEGDVLRWEWNLDLDQGLIFWGVDLLSSWRSWYAHTIEKVLVQVEGTNIDVTYQSAWTSAKSGRRIVAWTRFSPNKTFLFPVNPTMENVSRDARLCCHLLPVSFATTSITLGRTRLLPVSSDERNVP